LTVAVRWVTPTIGSLLDVPKRPKLSHAGEVLPA
jgi:hypothetical protein